MKRGGQLKRRKLLKRGRPPKRGKPLKRGTKRLRRRKPLQVKGGGHDWVAMAEAIYPRSKGWCERCKKVRIKKVDVRKSNIHHILARSKGGPDDPQNLGFICSFWQFMGREDFSCHTWIKNHPKEARAQGWLK